VEPRRPPAIRDHPRAPWLVVATVCVGAFMGQLDASIVTLAFPTLERDFAASVASVEWVALAYLVVLAGTLTAVGHFADMVGRKSLYTYGFIVFAAASVACGLAPNLGSLVAFRAVQALGAAMLQANSVALIATALPRDAVGAGLGAQGAAQALGLALGPTVGGVLIDTLGWRWIFFVNGPVGLLGVLAGWFFLPRSRDLAARAPFDWTGLVLLLPAIGLGLIGLSAGQHSGYTTPGVLAEFVVSAFLLGGFIRHERRCDHPLLELRLFADRVFSSGIVAGLFAFLVLFGTLFVVPFFLENGHGVAPARTGLIVSALPAALGLIAPWAGRRAARPWAFLLSAAGLTLVGAALLAAGFVSRGIAVVVVILAAVGLGLGAFNPPNNTAIMTSVPRQRSGQAAGILNTTRALGSALGIAVAGGAFDAARHGYTHPTLGVPRGFHAAVITLSGFALAAAALTLVRGAKRRPSVTAAMNHQ